MTRRGDRHHLGAVWFADIVGYTTLASRDEKRSIALATLLQSIAHRVVSAYQGRVLKHIGDEIMAEFPSTDSAVRAAIVVLDLFRKSTTRAGFDPSELRVGIHVGDLTVGHDGDVYGQGVNGAARIRERAAPGEILVSDDVWRQLKSREGFRFDDRGDHELKGIGSLRLYATCYEGALVDESAASGPTVLRGFGAELVRRRIPRTAAGYALGLVLLVLSSAGGILPPDVARTALIIAVIGFPLALLVTWFVERSAEGLRWSPSVPDDAPGMGWPHPHVLLLVVVGTTLSVAGAGAGLLVLSSLEARRDVAGTFFRNVPIDRAIAVLPFAVSDTDTSQQYFASGVTDEILARLATVEDLRVISPTSVRQYTRTEKTDGQIGVELGVGRILRGTVQRQGDRVRITVRLVDARTEEVLWADRYDRELADVFAIQTDIARRIVDTLRIELGPEETAQLQVAPMRDLEAYDLYLKGREYFFQLNPRDNLRAIELFRRALELDPAYAPGWAGLSEAYAFRVSGGEDAMRDSADWAARRALELDAELPEGHVAQGIVELYGPNPAAAADGFRRAIQLNPNHAFASLGLGVIETERGRVDEGLRWIERAARLEPTTALYAMQVGRGYWILGDFQTSERWLKRALDLQPDQGVATAELARVALMRGDSARAKARLADLLVAAREHPSYYEEALSIAIDLGDLERAREIVNTLPAEAPDRLAAERAYLELEAGRPRRAHAILNAAIAQLLAVAPTTNGWDPWYGLARAHAMRGDARAAAEALDEATRLGWRLYHDARMSVVFDPVWSDPAMQRVLERVRREIERMRRRVES